MSTQLIVSQLTVRSSTGGVLPFKKWAESQQLIISEKAARKAAMVTYDAEKKAAFTDNRRLMGAVATDPRFDVKKFQIVTDKENNVTGYNIAGRAPTKADEKRAAKLSADDKDAKIKALEAQHTALMAKIEAMGVSAADLEQIPALA
jgi:hypothetical protein